MSTRLVFAALGFVVLACTACSTAHYPVNPPMTVDPGAGGYSFRHLARGTNSDSLTVMMTISGGGYRAAALGYAVIELLDETRIRWEGEERTLLQELDVVSAVSGGSVAAAYYAMDPERFLADFRSRVLDLDLQAALLAKAVSPSSLWRQTSPRLGRGDLLQEVLDEQIYRGVTFGALPRRRPMVYINATDMRHGDRFEFSQDQFDHLCSDLGGVPLARAVAASMAVPVLMSPITLWNYSDRCPAPPRQLVPVSVGPGHGSYIHLVDGALSDNIGIRAPLDHVMARGGLQQNSRLLGRRGVRKFVFIVVDAQVEPTHPEDESADTPGLLRQLRSAIDVPINRYSQSSLAQLHASIAQWGLESGQDFHVVAVSLHAARTRDREAAKQIPTSMRISPAQIDTLRRLARDELGADPAWRRLLGELGAGLGPED